MNYFDLETKLRELKLDRALESLREAVRTETHVLLDRSGSFAKSRKTAKAVSAAHVEAANLYADEVLAALVNPVPLRPNDVLNYRRKAAAWAIAQLIREAELIKVGRSPKEAQ